VAKNFDKISNREFKKEIVGGPSPELNPHPTSPVLARSNVVCMTPTTLSRYNSKWLEVKKFFFITSVPHKIFDV
jgi:hypothetical protein